MLKFLNEKKENKFLLLQWIFITVDFSCSGFLLQWISLAVDFYYSGFLLQ